MSRHGTVTETVTETWAIRGSRAVTSLVDDSFSGVSGTFRADRHPHQTGQVR